MRTYSYNQDYLSGLTDGWNRLSFPIISILAEKTIKTCSPRRILDFGSGSGTYAGVLSASGAEVHACDISEHCVAACSGKYSSVILLEEVANLPSAQFDMIFSTEVLEHIKDYHNTVQHFHRVLRPHGVVLLTTTTYSTSVFTMLYQAKNAGFGIAGILKAMGCWMAGYFSVKRRDQFVGQWCFEPLGGHYHGFLKRELLQAFRSAGFSVEKSGVFYPVEPMQMPFLYSHTLSQLMNKGEWSKLKRSLAMLIYMVAHPLNGLLKILHLFANNVYVVARKGGA